MFETSQETEKLDAALAKAQGEFGIAVADATNPMFKSKYARLAAFWGAARVSLSKNGISVTQWPTDSPAEGLTMVTRLAHGGQWMRATFTLPVDRRNAHGFGSAITYAKKFTLAAALGLVSEEEVDDDGNEAVSQKQPENVTPKKELHTAKATEKQLKLINTRAGLAGMTYDDIKSLLDKMSVPDLKDLPIGMVNKMLDEIGNFQANKGDGAL